MTSARLFFVQIVFYGPLPPSVAIIVLLLRVAIAASAAAAVAAMTLFYNSESRQLTSSLPANDVINGCCYFRRAMYDETTIADRYRQLAVSPTYFSDSQRWPAADSTLFFCQFRPVVFYA